MPRTIDTGFSAMPYQVAICTYNGAHHIEEQLASILRQQPAPASIIVSDDGSTDATLEIILRMAGETSIPIRVIPGPGQGIVCNVFNALAHTNAPYVFMADQDDIWLDNKAALFCAQMSNTRAPHLIFSDAWVWQPEPESRASFWQLDGLVPEHIHHPQRMAFHNTVQGASMCLNRALIQQLKPHSDIAMHDWWAGLITSAFGQASIIREPTLLYRQHGANLVGSQALRSPHSNWLRQKIKAARIVLRQARAFAELYAEQMDTQPRTFFAQYQQAISANLFGRLWFILRWRPHRKNTLRTLTLWLSIIAIRCAPLSAVDNNHKALS